MPVAFEELVGSPQIRISDGRFLAMRRFKIAWADTVEFAVNLLGGYFSVGESFGYSPPAQFPAVPQAICREVEIDPFPPDRLESAAGPTLDSATNQPLYALVEARYRIQDHANHRQRRSNQPEVPAGTYLTYQGELGTMNVGLAGRHFQWFDTGEPLPAETRISLVLPTEQFRLKWERVPLPLVPWDTIRDLRGTVNAAQFLNHEAETVLFLGVKTSYEFQISGDVLVDLDYAFSVREHPGTADPLTKYGWNHEFRAPAVDGEHWTRFVARDSGAPVYPAGDFGLLFGFVA